MAAFQGLSAGRLQAKAAETAGMPSTAVGRMGGSKECHLQFRYLLCWRRLKNTPQEAKMYKSQETSSSSLNGSVHGNPSISKANFRRKPAVCSDIKADESPNICGSL